MRHPFETPKTAGGIRYFEKCFSIDTAPPIINHWVECYCHGETYDTPAEMVKAHKPGGEGTVSLCDASDVGMAQTCCCCGGWVYAAGNGTPIPGSVPALQYCSDECHDDWENYLAERDEQRRRRREFYEWEDALYAASYVPGGEG